MRINMLYIFNLIHIDVVNTTIINNNPSSDLPPRETVTSGQTIDKNRDLRSTSVVHARHTSGMANVQEETNVQIVDQMHNSSQLYQTYTQTDSDIKNDNVMEIKLLPEYNISQELANVNEVNLEISDNQTFDAQNGQWNLTTREWKTPSENINVLQDGMRQHTLHDKIDVNINVNTTPVLDLETFTEHLDNKSESINKQLDRTKKAQKVHVNGSLNNKNIEDRDLNEYQSPGSESHIKYTTKESFLENITTKATIQLLNSIPEGNNQSTETNDVQEVLKNGSSLSTCESELDCPEKQCKI